VRIGKLVGFYRETHRFLERSGKVLPSVKDFMDENLPPAEERLVAYLRSGQDLLYIGGWAYLTHASEIGELERPGFCLTDGVWIWPSELPYYVTRWGISLPFEFTEHIVQNQWRVPESIPAGLYFPGARAVQ
jgi:hypothetical protein